MKIVIERAALLPALELAASAADAKSTMSILGTVRIRTVLKSAITISSTDLCESVVSAAPAIVSEPGDWCVDAKGLIGRVKLLPDQAALTIEVRDAKLKISIPRLKQSYTMLAISGEEAPETEEAPKPFAEPTAADLALHIRAVFHAISTDKTRPFLNGMLLHVKTGVVTVATDGHRLTYSGHVPFEASEQDLIVPREAVVHLLKLLDHVLPDDHIQVGRTKAAVFFTCGSVTISSKMSTDVKFPPYQHVISDPKITVRVQPKEVLRALKAVAVVGKSILIEGNDRGDSLLFISRDLEGGEGVESIQCSQYTGKIRIGLTTAYVQDAIADARPLADGMVTLGFIDDRSPLRVDGDGTLAVIMAFML